jgi:hypothetical protein
LLVEVTGPTPQSGLQLCEQRIYTSRSTGIKRVTKQTRR